MEKKKTIAATAADLKAIVNNETGNSIQKSVLFYIDGRDPRKMVSSFEREMIAENAWAHVVEKSASFKADKGAKFKTWATKVARNFASDELKKLKNDALHMTGSLYEEQPGDKDDAKKGDAAPVRFSSSMSVSDSSERLYWKDALESLKDIVSTYNGRDRDVAEMLIEQRTKEEIMVKMQMTGGNVDVCKSRVLKKMRADLLKAGFSLAA